MRSGLLFILTNLLFYISLSQDIVHSSGEYQSDIFPNETFEQGKLRIRESAIINALKKAFGVAVFQGNNLFVSNKESGV
ncbi:MAG TPA: hypothetical protein DEF82_02450, partial [Crocinitomicaceae bacterium]|nr:hypothetical protein [Crocinitomicaceae bacterium]